MNNVKSTVPLDIGFANPALYRVREVVAATPNLRNIMVYIQQLGKEGKTMAQIKQLLHETHHGSDLRGFFQTYRATPDAPPVIPVPPPSKQIYGRFYEGTSITDIGSGNGMKLKKFSGGLKITCVDPSLDVEPGVFMKLHACDIAELLPTLNPDAIMTSFMSLCQLPAPIQFRITDFDGLHMVPDHAQLLSMGAAVPLENGVLVHAPRRDYEDQPLVVSGYNVQPGYQIVTSYAARVVNVHLSPRVRTISDYNVAIDASPVDYEDINLRDVSMKMDGVAHEIEFHDGRVNVIDRALRERIGTSDFADYMCIHAEELQNCWTLIRVVVYRGYVPPHSYEGLLSFVERVKIKIDDKPVCAPPEWTASDVDRNHALVRYIDENGTIEHFREKIDGLISRDRERDSYCKHRWTVDLYNTQEEQLANKLKDRGMTLDSSMEEGLWEYGVDRNGHSIILQPLRKRDDKTTPTTINTVIYLLSRITLDEGLALSRLGHQ